MHKHYNNLLAEETKVGRSDIGVMRIAKTKGSGELRNEPEERTDYGSLGNVWTGNITRSVRLLRRIYLTVKAGSDNFRNRYYDSSTGHFITGEKQRTG